MTAPASNLPLEEQTPGVLLRLLLWGEARGEMDNQRDLDARGMYAVGRVALNRSHYSRWKNMTLRDVILEPKQFSCFNQDDPNRFKLLHAPSIEPLSWARADAVGDLLEWLSEDTTHGATHYVVSGMWGKPGRGWYQDQEILAGRTMLKATIGHHSFATAA